MDVGGGRCVYVGMGACACVNVFTHVGGGN
jgi:hypothetical protein